MKTMEDLYIKGSAKTPEIQFLGNEGQLILHGRAIPENSIDFFLPLHSWIDEYKQNAKEETVIDVRLEYFNTSSSKCLLDIFRQLEKMNGTSTNVKVRWYFERDDEDMEEAGQDYQVIVGLPFEIIEVEEI